MVRIDRRTPPKSLADLALFGGSAAFDEPLHVGRPNLGDRARLMERIESLLDRRWLTNNGIFVQELESRLTALTGATHCVATCNATLALQLTVQALGIEGEVIVPAFTFVATAHALRWQGLRPVFCDVDPQTHQLDPRAVSSLRTSETAAIVAVHLWGQSCDVFGLEEVSRELELPLIFDAAHALGCTNGGRELGAFGQASIYSFHATKVANSFEGGCIATDDDELADRLRLSRNFGFADMDQVACLGTNAKMSEVSAAMGLTSLESFDEFVTANRSSFESYARHLDRLPGLKLLKHDARERSNYQYIVVEVDEALAGLDRDTLLRVLVAENVLARRYFYPGCHRVEPYRSEQPLGADQLPVTESLVKNVLVLPTGPAVDDQTIETLCGIVRFALENSSEILDRCRGLGADRPKDGR